PLVAAIPAYATAPALILVGALMCGAVARVKWDDFSEAFPAFMTLVATPLSFSIATGLSLGLLSFTFVKLGTGRHREISPLIWVLSVLFLLRYAFLGAEKVEPAAPRLAHHLCARYASTSVCVAICLQLAASSKSSSQLPTT